MHRSTWLATVALGLSISACADEPAVEPPDVDPTPGAPIAAGSYHKPLGALEAVARVEADGSSRLFLAPDDGANVGTGPFEGDVAKLKLRLLAHCGPLLVTRPRANAIRLRWNGEPAGAGNCTAFDGIYVLR